MPENPSPDAGRELSVQADVSPRDDEPSQRVGWLELFYDLSFVVMIAAIAHRLRGDPSAVTLVATVFLMVIVWTVWFNVTALHNVIGSEAQQRLAVFIAMAGVGVAAIGVADLRQSAWWFCVGYAVARAAPWPAWAMLRRRQGQGQVRPFAIGPGVALCWLASAAVPLPARWWIWVALVLADLAFVRFGGEHGAYEFRAGHLVERVGLFVMLVLGEAVAVIATTLADHRSPLSIVTAVVAFTLVCALWWLVYEATMSRLEEAAERPRGLAAAFELAGGGQFAVVLGLVLVSAGLAGAVENADGPASAARVTPGGLASLCAGLLLVMLGVASLSLRVLEYRIGGGTTSRIGRWGRGVVISLPVVAVWALARRWPPPLVVGVLLAVILSLCALQRSGQRKVDAWFDAGMPGGHKRRAVSRGRGGTDAPSTEIAESGRLP